MITLTDSVHSPINLYSSCNLIARSDMASIVDSLVAPLSVVNALVVALCMKRQKEVVHTLETMEKIWGPDSCVENVSGGLREKYFGGKNWKLIHEKVGDC